MLLAFLPSSVMTQPGSMICASKYGLMAIKWSSVKSSVAKALRNRRVTMAINSSSRLANGWSMFISETPSSLIRRGSSCGKKDSAHVTAHAEIRTMEHPPRPPTKLYSGGPDRSPSAASSPTEPPLVSTSGRRRACRASSACEAKSTSTPTRPEQTMCMYSWPTPRSHAVWPQVAVTISAEVDSKCRNVGLHFENKLCAWSALIDNRVRTCSSNRFFSFGNCSKAATKMLWCSKHTKHSDAALHRTDAIRKDPCSSKAASPNSKPQPEKVPNDMAEVKMSTEPANKIAIDLAGDPSLKMSSFGWKIRKSR
mmetsp:Transcript_59414/g.181258  ORF Transcript_59414/g.181258 Transcript_59414/m.181258 type:complete len:310 (-) Transcript_59414:1180-2109(-)